MSQFGDKISTRTVELVQVSLTAEDWHLRDHPQGHYTLLLLNTALTNCFNDPRANRHRVEGFMSKLLDMEEERAATPATREVLKGVLDEMFTHYPPERLAHARPA